MEESNLELIQRLFSGSEQLDVAPMLRAWLADDNRSMPAQAAAVVAAIEAEIAPEFAVDTSGVDMPGLVESRGLEAFRELWTRWLEAWERYSWTLSNWTEIGEHVVVDVKIRATGKTSGAEVIFPHCDVWTVRDGKLLRWAIFKDRAAALRAVRGT